MWPVLSCALLMQPRTLERASARASSGTRWSSPHVQRHGSRCALFYKSAIITSSSSCISLLVFICEWPQSGVHEADATTECLVVSHATWVRLRDECCRNQCAT